MCQMLIKKLCVYFYFFVAAANRMKRRSFYSFAAADWIRRFLKCPRITDLKV